jgi:hypothetical protein
MEVVGSLAQDWSLIGTAISGIPVLGAVDMLEAILRTHVIDEVIFAVSLGSACKPYIWLRLRSRPLVPFGVTLNRSPAYAILDARAVW